MASLELHWQGEYPHRTKTSVWVEGLTHHAMLKGEALRWPRRYAAERGQKFSDKSDLINLDDLRTGPLRNCLLCNQNPERSWDNDFVCSACRDAHCRGLSLAGKRQTWALYLGDLSHHQTDRFDADSAEKDMAKHLLTLAGTRVGKWHKIYSADDRDLVAGHIMASERRKTSTGSAHHVNLTQQQAEALQKTIDAIWKMCEQAYQNGLQYGESFVRQLADGRVKMADLLDRAAR